MTLAHVADRLRRSTGIECATIVRHRGRSRLLVDVSLQEDVEALAATAADAARPASLRSVGSIEPAVEAATVAVLVPMPVTGSRGSIPADWLDAGRTLVGSEGGAEAVIAVGGHILKVDADYSHVALDLALRTGSASCFVLQGDRGAGLLTNAPAFAVAIRSATIEGRRRAMEVLANFVLARTPRPAWAAIDFSSMPGCFSGPTLEYQPDPYSGSIYEYQEIWDEAVPGIFPWQLIGPGHSARLKGPHRRMYDTGDGHFVVDLTEGDVSRAPDAVFASGVDALRGALLTRRERAELWQARRIASA